MILCVGQIGSARSTDLACHSNNGKNVSLHAGSKLHSHDTTISAATICSYAEGSAEGASFRGKSWRRANFSTRADNAWKACGANAEHPKGKWLLVSHCKCIKPYYVFDVCDAKKCHHTHEMNLNEGIILLMQQTCGESQHFQPAICFSVRAGTKQNMCLEFLRNQNLVFSYCKDVCSVGHHVAW